MTHQNISVDNLRDRLARGDPVTVVDIRPEEEYAEWHVPGSLNVPVYEDLHAGDPSGLEGIEPTEGPVVTVCGRGAMAAKATQALRDQGIEALTLEGGLRAWSLAWNTATLPLGSNGTILQVRRTGKGCLSYLVGSQGQAAIVDPSLDPDVYVDLAKKRDWTITHVLETHVHADHLSRARSLADATGASHLLPEDAPVDFPHQAMADGDAVQVGEVRVEALATPGHTPESATFVVDDHALLTGDTLFPGSVGRPDLDADDGARDRARALHRSLKDLLSFPEEFVVLPAHASHPLGFEGDVHGARLGDLPNRIDLLNLEEKAFVDEILDRLPETPPNHERIVEHNRTGTYPTGDVTELEAGANRCAAG